MRGYIAQTPRRSLAIEPASSVGSGIGANAFVVPLQVSPLGVTPRLGRTTVVLVVAPCRLDASSRLHQRMCVMSVAPPYPPLSAVAPDVSPANEDVDEDVDVGENGESVTKCGRCRLTFVRHPSISVGDAPRWWLCPPCRSRLLGDESTTRSRWSS